MQMKAITIYGMITSITSKKDGSAKLTFDTNEIAGEQAAILWELKGKEGYCNFSPTGSTEIEIPEKAPEFKGDKTPSQRLRGVLYRIWEQNEKTDDWEIWYRRKMENIIETLKEKLD